MKKVLITMLLAILGLFGLTGCNYKYKDYTDLSKDESYEALTMYLQNLYLITENKDFDGRGGKKEELFILLYKDYISNYGEIELHAVEVFDKIYELKVKEETDFYSILSLGSVFIPNEYAIYNNQYGDINFDESEDTTSNFSAKIYLTVDGVNRYVNGFSSRGDGLKIYPNINRIPNPHNK